MNSTVRVTIHNSSGLRLAGILHIPHGTVRAAIVMAHGFTGDRDEWGMFVTAADELCTSGFSVLRFDFAGSGESDDTSITVAKQVDDLQSAIGYVRGKGYPDIGLLGLSLGGLCSVLAYNEEIRTIVLWAPVTKAKTPTKLKDVSRREELKEKGFIIIKNRIGREFRIDREYLLEREAINQRQILSRVRCPVLIIHGTDDDIVPPEHSVTAMESLQEGSRLELVEEGNHGFNGKMDRVMALSQEWFRKHLPNQ